MEFSTDLKKDFTTSFPFERKDRLPYRALYYREFLVAQTRKREPVRLYLSVKKGEKEREGKKGERKKRRERGEIGRRIRETELFRRANSSPGDPVF